MKFFRIGLLFASFLALILVVAACGSKESDTTSNADENNPEDTTESTQNLQGGELKIAIDAQPPTLDQPASTSTNARDTSRLVFETLLTTDSNFNAVPMLAESVETDDNKTFTFHLRQGVKFHNGEEMVAEDVIASMKRWLEKSTITGSIFNGATWEAPDEYTVVLDLPEPSALLLDTIATSKQAPAIMPKEIVESADAEGVKEYIGTGPYKFVEWKQDQYIHFTKYEDYQSVEDEADGLSGKKEALVDDIYFYIVPDTSTRLVGLQTGEYDFAYGIPADNYEQLENDPNLQSHFSVSGSQFLVYNTAKGPVSDFKLRQAINTALDSEEILMAAFRDPDLFTLSSGYLEKEIENWASDAGNEYYNINDPEKAKQMLEEIGYDGQEIRLMTTRDYDHHYNTAVVIQEQLSNIGLNVKLEIFDWPTINERQYDQDAWDIYVMGFSSVSTPTQFLGLSPTWAAGVADERVAEDLRAIELAPTIEEAKEIWDGLQLYVWEELLPVSTLGSYNSLYGSSTNVEGLTTFSGPIFWNTTVNNNE